MAVLVIKARQPLITEVRCRKLNFQGSTIRSKAVFRQILMKRGVNVADFVDWFDSILSAYKPV